MIDNQLQPGATVKAELSISKTSAPSDELRQRSKGGDARLHRPDFPEVRARTAACEQPQQRDDVDAALLPLSVAEAITGGTRSALRARLDLVAPHISSSRRTVPRAHRRRCGFA
jgi:hypothetical protein